MIYQDDLITELNELSAQYEAGFYTLPELVWVTIDLISQSMTEESWCSLPKWLQIRIVETLRKFSEKKMIFGHVKPEIALQQNKIVKAWLIEKGYLVP